MGHDPSDIRGPHDSPRTESPIADDGPGSALTPMGQVDSIGSFARGLGPRRTKLALAIGGGVLLLIAVLIAVRVARGPDMGFYHERVFPRLMNIACNSKENRRIRAEVCKPLAGEVLEIGFGTGLNLPHLPPAVGRLLAVDPLQQGRELAARRLADTQVAVDFAGLDGQSIALADDAVDAALSTWTLCSIPDPVAAVREVARVLRPGGTLHFVEHGMAPDSKVRAWQDRLNGLQRRMACGCNLNRNIPAIIEAGGLTITELTTFYAKGDPKFVGWTFQGTARVDAAPV